MNGFLSKHHAHSNEQKKSCLSVSKNNHIYFSTFVVFGLYRLSHFSNLCSFNLTLLHSEGQKLLRVFGLSKCNRLKAKIFDDLKYRTRSWTNRDFNQGPLAYHTNCSTEPNGYRVIRGWSNRVLVCHCICLRFTPSYYFPSFLQMGAFSWFPVCFSGRLKPFQNETWMFFKMKESA